MFDDGTVRTGSDNEPERGLLEAVMVWQRSVEVEQLDADGIELLVSEVHQARDVLNGVLVRCGDQARLLAASGAGPPPEEAMMGGGRARSLTGRDLAAASEVTGAFPELAAVVRSGAARLESVAPLVRLWRRLDDAEREQFVARFDAELASKISTLPPDTFQALVQRRGRSVRTDHGQADAEREQAANKLTRYRTPDGRYQLRPRSGSPQR